MESRKSKEEYEIKILSIFTDISNFQDKNFIEFQKLIQKIYTPIWKWTLLCFDEYDVRNAGMENGYNSNIVFPRSTVNALGNTIKENEKGVFYNFKDEQGEIHVASLFFPEQTQNPEGIINASKDKIQQMDNLKDVSMVIASSEPKEYLGTYIAACRSGMKLSVDPQIAEEFKGKIMPTLENDIRDPEKRDKNMPSLSNLLFEAEKRGADICRTVCTLFNAPKNNVIERTLRTGVSICL